MGAVASASFKKLALVNLVRKLGAGRVIKDLRRMNERAHIGQPSVHTAQSYAAAEAALDTLEALQAKLDCEAVLKEDGGHVKCKFRRAQALVELGSIEQACDVFKALMEVPSLQREARAGLLDARKMLRAHREAERDLFRGKIKPVLEAPVEKPPRKNALERTVVASLAGRRAAGRAASDAY